MLLDRLDVFPYLIGGRRMSSLEAQPHAGFYKSRVLVLHYTVLPELIFNTKSLYGFP